MTTIYSDGTTRVPVLWSVIPTLTTLAAAAVIAKFWRLWRKRSRPMAEDFMLLLATGVSISCCVDLLLQMRRGFGNYVPLDPSIKDAKNLKMFMKSYMVAEILYHISTGFIQTSFLLYYLRRFPKSISRYAIYFALFFAVSTTTSAVFGTAFQCKPVSSWWDASIPGRCMNADVFFLASAGLHIVANLTVFILPMPTLFRSPCQPALLKDRLGVSAVYAVGLVAILCSFMRLCGLGAPDNTDNPTYNNVNLALWSISEINIGIITFCLPSFARVTTSRHRPRFTGDNERIQITIGNKPSRHDSNSHRPTVGRRASNFDVESSMSMTVGGLVLPAPGPYGHNDNVSNYEARVMGNAADSKDHVVMTEDAQPVNVIVKTTNFTISREEARNLSMGS